MVIIFILTSVLSIGCAQVQVKAPKDPIKVDIAMRVDVYQHVKNDIDAIEDIVSGDNKSLKSEVKPISFMDILMPSAYAEEDILAQIESTALSRQTRYSQIMGIESKGIAGENRSGLLEIRDHAGVNAEIEKAIKDENNDRNKLYGLIAAKNKTTVENVKKLYSKKLQDNAPSGTPIEVYDQASGAYTWKIK